MKIESLSFDEEQSRVKDNIVGFGEEVDDNEPEVSTNDLGEDNYDWMNQGRGQFDPNPNDVVALTEIPGMS